MNLHHKHRNGWSIALSSALLACALGGCGEEHHRRRPAPEPLPAPEAVIVVPDERGVEHRGFYDRQGYWHGGYYDERREFRSDERDWGRAHDRDWDRHYREHEGNREER